MTNATIRPLRTAVEAPMRIVSLCLLLAACSDPESSLGGMGDACSDSSGCAANLVCIENLCGVPPVDAGTGARDAGQQADTSGNAGFSEDAGQATDAGESDAGLVAPTVRFSAPDPQSSYEEGQPIGAVVVVEGDGFAGLTLRWSSDRDGQLGQDTVPPTGRISREFSLDELGTHVLSAELFGGEELIASDSIGVNLCGWQMIGDFNQDVEGWQLYGDASRDQRGWLELTGNTRSRKGAIYKVNNTISPGNVHLAFRISTGHCNQPGPCNSNASGADGFAMSIWDLAAAELLDRLFEEAARGGGLGFGVAGRFGDFEGNAFHVEFDTWYNDNNGDPIRDNHIAVALDGDPSNIIAWTAAPEIEDNRWHEVELTIQGNHLVVRLDGNNVIDQQVDGLDFKGGYIGFSGTTGYYHNFHRFDELRTRVCH